MKRYSVGDLVLFQGWRVGLVVDTRTDYSGQWVYLMLPERTTAWLSSNRLEAI